MRQLSETITILLQQRTPPLQVGFYLSEAERLLIPRAHAAFRCDVICLSSANDYNLRNADTVDVIKAYRTVLKDGEQTWRLLFRYYLLAFMTNHRELFEHVEDWCILPSSKQSLQRDGRLIVGSDVMEECKEIVRYMFGGKKGSPIFRRAEAVQPNKFRAPATKNLPCAAATINYPSLVLDQNKDYDAKKLKGRVVCVLDDYTTSGNSFEAARSLLLAAGVKRVVMLALGKFGSKYNYETFAIKGDLFTTVYTWTSVRREELDVQARLQPAAIAEFTRLRDMVTLRQQQQQQRDRSGVDEEERKAK